MSNAIVMPKVGQAVESCMLSEWCKKVGEPVQAGEVLFRFETDKSVFDEEAKESGIFLAAFFEEGDDIPCLTNIGAIGQPGEDVEALRPRGNGKEPVQETTEKVAEILSPTQNPVLAARSPATAKEEIFASPRAKHLAEKLGVNYRSAAATGAEGRIIEVDIRRLAATGASSTQAAFEACGGTPRGNGTGLGGRITLKNLTESVSPCILTPDSVSDVATESEYTDVKLSNVRKVTAKAMTQSLTSMAQLTHTVSFDATTIMELRKKLKNTDSAFGAPRITNNDMILYAVSRVLMHHPDLNANFLGDKMRHFHHVNLGIAVDTPRGLLVPTLFHADTKSLTQISEEARALAEKCRQGSVKPEQMQGASFTVSNLGSFGIEHFTPIVNPPQTGILGVDCTVDRIRSVNGALSVYPAMGLSLTYDHRALDGAPASRFLQELRTTLENFYAILI